MSFSSTINSTKSNQWNFLAGFLRATHLAHFLVKQLFVVRFKGTPEDGFANTTPHIPFSQDYATTKGVMAAEQKKQTLELQQGKGPS